LVKIMRLACRSVLSGICLDVAQSVAPATTGGGVA
jgi:hypothetical protein